MSKNDFLQMVPALLYGISLAELAMYMGNVFGKKQKLYWEHLLALLLAFETIIFNWYIFFDRLESLDKDYASFLIQLLSPICFFIFAANILFENDDPSRNMFLEKRKQIFASLTLFMVVNLSTVFYFTPNALPPHMPLIGLGLIVANIFWDSKILRSALYTGKFIQIIIVLMTK